MGRRVKEARANRCRHIALLALLTVATQALAMDSPSALGDALVAQLRELPAPLPVGVGRNLPESEILRARLYAELGSLRTEGVQALARGYGDPDVRLRRNVALALVSLGMGHDSTLPQTDLEPALASMIAALADSDADVRAWSAQALASLKERAAPAVPALIVMLEREGEGDQLNACGALRGIGAPARDALPALRQELSSPYQNVRWCAGGAIESLQGKSPQ